MKEKVEAGGRALPTAASVVFVFLVLRVLAVADYDWRIAFAIVHTIDLNDGVAILFGSLMASEVVTAILLIWLIPMLVIGFFWPTDRGGRHPAAILIFSVAFAALIALTLTFHAWWIPLGTLGVLAILVVLDRYRRKGVLHQAVVFVLRSVGVTMVVGILVLAAIVRTPWMPLEKIETRQGVITGYVLEAEPGFVKVLTVDDRHFLILTDNDVLTRTEIEEGH